MITIICQSGRNWPHKTKAELRWCGQIITGKSLPAKAYHASAAEAEDINMAVTYAKDVVENGGYDLITDPMLNEDGDTLSHSL